MFINPSEELMIFLSFFVCSILSCIVFDFFRALRKNIKMNTFFVLISDILFWIFTAIITAFCLFYVNDGLVRAFVICAFVIGGFLYFFTISRIVFFLFCKIIEIICNFINLFLKILLTPFKFSYKIILVWFLKIRNKFNSGARGWIYQKI